MGTDIHMYIERYERGGENEDTPPGWVKIGPVPRPAPDPIPAPDWDDKLTEDENDEIYATFQDSYPTAWGHFPDDDGNRILADRNYVWFGLLANVVNSSRVPSISSPRGIPPDLSDGVRQVLHHWERFFPGAAHSHSWLLLEELIEYDYGQQFVDMRANRVAGTNLPVVLRDFLLPCYFEYLARLCLLGAPREIRLVFFFDS